MSGYYKNPNRGFNRPRYKQRKYYRQRNEEREEEKELAVEGKTKDEGIQINLLDGIPCRIIPINPDDYPRLLALLNMQETKD